MAVPSSAGQPRRAAPPSGVGAALGPWRDGPGTVGRGCEQPCVTAPNGAARPKDGPSESGGMVSVVAGIAWLVRSALDHVARAGRRRDGPVRDALAPDELRQTARGRARLGSARRPKDGPLKIARMVSVSQCSAPLCSPTPGDARAAAALAPLPFGGGEHLLSCSPHRWIRRCCPRASNAVRCPTDGHGRPLTSCSERVKPGLGIAVLGLSSARPRPTDGPPHRARCLDRQVRAQLPDPRFGFTKGPRKGRLTSPTCYHRRSAGQRTSSRFSPVAGAASGPRTGRLATELSVQLNRRL
jgi:hypothetical protein